VYGTYEHSEAYVGTADNAAQTHSYAYMAQAQVEHNVFVRDYHANGTQYAYGCGLLVVPGCSVCDTHFDTLD
jgi:hypothetical protein